jgi:drug/metabolite transporter (DMT)-like permease
VAGDRTRRAAPATLAAPGAPGALDRPPPADLALIALAVTAVSTSAPLIRYAVAPTMALAMWRNMLAAAVVLPVTGVLRRAELRALSGREWRLCLVSGVVLALHFATWIPSLRYTSVASSVALVAVQPVWAALIARWRGDHVPRAGWIGIWLAVVGAAVLSGLDFDIGLRYLWGDLLALVGGVMAAVYVTLGAQVRQTVGTMTYTAICYSAAAVVLLTVCLVGRQPISGYDAAPGGRSSGSPSARSCSATPSSAASSRRPARRSCRRRSCSRSSARPCSPGCSSTSGRRPRRSRPPR